MIDEFFAVREELVGNTWFLILVEDGIDGEVR